MPIKHYDMNWTFNYSKWAYNVFAKRCDMNMTQAEFAGHCGCSPSVISHIETGHWVSMPTIIVISDILNLSLLAFIER